MNVSKNSFLEKEINLDRKIAGKFLNRYPSLWVRPTGDKGEVTFWNILRGITGKFRVLPDYLIIGTQKGGTYSLYNYILQHPYAYTAHTKEICFFDRYFYRKETWYRANFPTKFQKFFAKIKNGGFITGEATHDYIFHNVVPARVKKVLPNVKLIVSLRNPTDRAYSQYIMRKKGGYEKLSFEDAIKIHDSRIQKSWWHHQRFAYLKRGIYVDELEHWFNYFPRKQFFIIETKELENSPHETYKKLCNFLEIKPFNLEFKKHNVGVYEKMHSETRKILIKYFRPHNARLYKLLGRKFEWDK